MMKLFEDYKNLNMIDRSFLNRYDNMNRSIITPNSKIEVNSVSPHRFTTVMEILKQPDVAAVIVRAHNRQLLFVTAKREIVRSATGFHHDYGAILSDYARRNLNNYGYGTQTATDSEAAIKTIISRFVKVFYEKAPEGTRKKWDILVIYKDPDVEDIRTTRQDRKEDIVLTPKDKGYEEYIYKLNTAFRERAKNFIDSRRPDLHSTEDFKQFILNNVKLDRLKFNGEIYKFDDEQLSIDKDSYSYLKYIDERNNKKVLYVMLEFNGIIPTVKEIRISPYRYGSIRDTQVLES